ncbi:MAG: nucleotidyltransferase domain-containing protein [Endomicrobium sp.]|jgi:predicted nucleotidyltransferase|nr:nucleotidyltransferase domain-containing protein [Endomicrobium sp.]
MIDNKIINLEQEYLDMVKNILSLALKDKNVKVYVFGSRVKGSVEKASDIDLALDANGISLDYFFIANIKYRFQESGIPYSVDIVDLNKISNDFRKCIRGDLVEIKYR